MSSPWRFLHSLQWKLILAFSSLVVAALVLAGTVFVLLSQDDEEERALDHTVATAPSIYSGFLQHLFQGDSLQELESYVREAAQQYDVHILMLDESSRVIVDTSGDLTGEQLAIPGSVQPQPQFAFRTDRYQSWQPQEGDPGSELILVSPFPPGTLLAQPSSPEPSRGQIDRIEQGLVLRYQLVVAVPESTIADAWLDLLPSLLIAAAIALPVAVALAVAAARYITRPLDQLTAAAHQMAQGTFDVDVSVSRQDEVGQLARAFSSMAMRVGEAYQQMRMLLASVSHDVKTPLTSILGFAQALRTGVVQGDAESRRVGEVIHQEAERLTNRLNDVIYLVELESGQVILQYEEIDLRTLVDGMLKSLVSLAEQKGVGVSTALAEGIVLSADRAKLERALENLLDNARKFTPAGGEIRVHTFVDPEQPGQARIQIENTAPDVHPEELPRLFERFYRRDRAGTGRSAGTGLGLAIARELIEVHAGTLEASVRDGEIILTAKMPRAQL
jgi:signal transduction histidine kinase